MDILIIYDKKKEVEKKAWELAFDMYPLLSETEVTIQRRDAFVEGFMTAFSFPGMSQYKRCCECKSYVEYSDEDLERGFIKCPECGNEIILLD